MKVPEAFTVLQLIKNVSQRGRISREGDGSVSDASPFRFLRSSSKWEPAADFTEGAGTH